jgi:hypothetical protein
VEGKILLLVLYLDDIDEVQDSPIYCVLSASYALYAAYVAYALYVVSVYEWFSCYIVVRKDGKSLFKNGDIERNLFAGILKWRNSYDSISSLPTFLF